MEQINQVREIMISAWSFLKKYSSDEPINESDRKAAFREICDLMSKHKAMKSDPLGSFAYDVLRASYDLIDKKSKSAADPDRPEIVTVDESIISAS